ncbi:anti-sigma factor [Alteromonas oceanisediminis]|uniref:anti-sigma factor n=1 Tax=Alteromonas oceanisediminis TaxID=2836180 RepID=UPI001BDA1ECC|nr:hypothetical protein [Alteromonas oceanisediminis]MBT0585137.1 hypothetical protein [Alteromonas oceanisediminis]
MSEQDKITLLSAWMDGQLNEQQRQAFEALCVADADFAARVEQSNALDVCALQFTGQTPPAWDKQASFVPHHQTRHEGGKWQFMPTAAVVFSILAMAISLTNFSIQVENGRLLAGFSLNNKPTMTAESVDQLVQARLADYQQTNQALFEQYVAALQKQQQQNGAQLTEYLLSSSRQERREDFAELIQFINQQRDDDQLFYARQLNNLQQEIYTQNGIPLQQSTPSSNGSVLPNEE